MKIPSDDAPVRGSKLFATVISKKVVQCRSGACQLRRLSLVAALLCAAIDPVLAQRLPFPPAPATAALASAQFNDRAKAVIETNACGREDDYLRIRGEMQQGNFGSQGEDLGHILVAKMAYIRTHSNSNFALSMPPCSTEIQRVRSEFEEHSRLVEDLGTSACSIETHADLATHKNPFEVIPVHVSVTVACMFEQVNQAIRAMKKDGKQMGSSEIPCISSLKFVIKDNGEWDVNVRELVRMLYLSGSSGNRQRDILAPSTIDYMYLHLLAARGKLSDGSYPTIFDCDEPARDELGSPQDTADRHTWFREFLDELGDFFKWAVITYITYGLVPGGGALIAAPFLLSASGAGDPTDIMNSHWEVRVPESENHRLMIESSKFLTNADMIARLESENYEHGGLSDAQARVRAWLMDRLQDIAVHDFQEYNSRPYNRYSLESIVNLHDFAARHGDNDLKQAARIVLDLAEAKFAATSNRGRRVVPFRRLADGDGDLHWYLYEAISGADHGIARSMLLSGQTQNLHEDRFGDLILGPQKIALRTLAEMVNTATSDYRLPPPVLATAVERRVFEQTMRHTGVERVEQSPAFTISAGGIRTPPPHQTFLGSPVALTKGWRCPRLSSRRSQVPT